jgi:hypothetical protein
MNSICFAEKEVARESNFPQSPNSVAVKDVPNLATGLQGDRGCVYIVPRPRHHVHMADLKAAAPHQP